jgi:hypothetical protein
VTRKQYRALELALEGVLVTLLGSIVVGLLLGVYALADLVF